MHTRMMILGMTIIAAFTGVSPALPITVVENGEPAAVIILSETPHPVAFEAAQELQRLIERISGAKLPIYPEYEFNGGMEGPRRSIPRILVGDSSMVRDLGVDLSALPKEGYVVKTATFSPKIASPRTHHRKPKNTYPVIILAGRDEASQNWSWRGDRANRYTRGSAYAVYSFLERELGVRWLWPGELGEVVPAAATITVDVKDRTEAPKLTMRVFRNIAYNWGTHWSMRGQTGTPTATWTRLSHESGMWLDHQRMGDSSNFIKPSREGAVGWVDKFGKTHPEWFALQHDGTRLVEELFGRIRICLANPQVIDQIAKEICETFAAHPDYTMHGIELSDVFGSYCQCDLCKAWGPTLSDTVARHWNAVAQKVAQTCPGKLLYAHPYHKYIDPPQQVTKLHPSIILFPVGQNISGYTAHKDRERSIKNWLGWAKITSNHMYWRPNYPSQDVGLPLNYARKIGQDVKLFYENKLMGVDIDNMVQIWAGSGLNFYVACKLFWDPQADVDALIRDYCEKGFGPAGPAMQVYFNEIEKITNRIAQTEEAGTHPLGLPGGESSGFGLSIYFTPQVTAGLHKLLDDAVARAGDDDTIKARIAFVRNAIAYGELEHKVNLAGRRADKGDLSDDEVTKIRELLKQRQAFIKSAVGTYWLEPEKAWKTGSWIEQILEQDAAGDKDVFGDLWLTHDRIMDVPEDWKFKTDPQAVSEKEQWFARDFNDAPWETIKVGKFWEHQGHKDYDGIAWYRRKLTLPASLTGKKVLFAFGAADENALVYIDGKLAGKYDIGPHGWDKRFVLDLTEHVKPGVEQVYAIRVIDAVGAGGLWKPIKVISPRPAGKILTLALKPTKDTYLRRNYPNTKHGKADSLAVGAKDYFRSLLIWQMPATLKLAQIHSAKIVLALRYAKGAGTYGVYPISGDWRERAATWSHSNGDVPWPNGDGAVGKRPDTPIVSVTINEETIKAQAQPTVSFDVTSYVRPRAAKVSEFGFIIILQEPMVFEVTMTPHSREAKEPDLRPRLEIEYELK